MVSQFDALNDALPENQIKTKKTIHDRQTNPLVSFSLVLPNALPSAFIVWQTWRGGTMKETSTSPIGYTAAPYPVFTQEAKPNTLLALYLGRALYEYRPYPLYVPEGTHNTGCRYRVKCQLVEPDLLAPIDVPAFQREMCILLAVLPTCAVGFSSLRLRTSSSKPLAACSSVA